MRVRVAEKKRGLEADKRYVPDIRCTAEEGCCHLRKDRLDEENQRSRKEDRDDIGKCADSRGYGKAGAMLRHSICAHNNIPNK